jgi:HSP20 family protein
MSYYRFDPHLGFEKFVKQIQNIAQGVEKEFQEQTGFGDVKKFKPAIDITETEQEYLFQAELPGLTKNDVNITINDDKILNIAGTKKRQNVDGKSTIREERTFGDFNRTLQLPEDVDVSKIIAKFEHGILELSVSRKQPEAPKTFEVKID